MKSKNRIRPFKKVCAAVMAAVLLCGGFGPSGGVLQSVQADTESDFEVQYKTSDFKDIPFIADEIGVSIYIEDPTAFALENATLETSVSNINLKSDRITTSSAYSSTALVWSGWDDKQVVQGSNSRAWTVQTDVTEDNPITLSWEGAAETQYGDSLDVKMVITGLDISYVGRKSTEKSDKGYWGLKTKENGYAPRVNLAIAKTTNDGLFSFQSYGVAAADSTENTINTVGYLTFGVDIDYHLEFYDEAGDQVDGTYLMYQGDVDVKDSYAYHLALAKNDWGTADVADADSKTWWNADSDFIESVTFPSSTSLAYAIDQDETYDTSLIQYSGRRVSGTWSTQNQIAAAGENYQFKDKKLIASVQAGVSAWETMTWTGSKCTTSLFESYSPGTGTITLEKAAAADESGDNGQNIDNPDLAGALYAVRQESEDGPIKGYFVTESNGTGYVASASAEEPDDETAVYVAYTPEDSDTPLYYTAGSSAEMEVNIGQYYVEELISPYGYELDTSTHKIEVEGGENEGVESTETVDYQQVTLTKESLTADGSENTSDSTSYKYTVVISGLESGQEIRYTVNGGTEKSAAADDEGIVTLSSSAIVLKNGQSAVFEIPVGAKYKITESANAKIASYTVTDANADSGGTIVSASGANTVKQTSLSTAAETADSGEDVTVKFTNRTQGRVTLTLTKSSVQSDGETADGNDTNYYSFSVLIGSLRSGDVIYYTDRSGTQKTVKYAGSEEQTISDLLLQSGDSITLDLPEGVTYRITEAANSKIPSYTVSDSQSLGKIKSSSGRAIKSETALSTGKETADYGEKVTVVFTNTSLTPAYGTLNFDANGGSYDDGSDLVTITYEGASEGYGENTTGKTQYDYSDGSAASDYEEPVREGYTFLGWALSADDDEECYDPDDYTSNKAFVNTLESLFPELINESTGSGTSSVSKYYLTVPGGDAYTNYTWYYYGDYTKSAMSSELSSLWEKMSTDAESGLTTLSDCEIFDEYDTDDLVFKMTTAADLLKFSSYNAADTEYNFLPDGTYYAVYETGSGKTAKTETTAKITLATDGNTLTNYSNSFVSFSQTLYAVWERNYGTLKLTKTADSQNIDDPDMAGALYAVHEGNADGDIAGYFITDENGNGCAASEDSADADSTVNLSVSYDDTTYYATKWMFLSLGTGTYYVEELVAPDGYAAKDIGTVTVKEDTVTTAKYTSSSGEPVEYLKVYLAKESLTADGGEDESDTTMYYYTIKIGGLEEGDVITYISRAGTEYTVTAGSDGQVQLYQGLKPGEQMWLQIPVGATYSFKETMNKKIASYTVTDANTKSGGTIVSASGANKSPYNALSTETETADSYEDVTVTFTNTTVEKVQVCLSKQSVDSDGNIQDDDTAYSVYVQFAAALGGETITYTSDIDSDNTGSISVTKRTGSATVSIKSGETLTFSNVPVGAEYYFREESNGRIASYQITNSADGSGTVEGSASGSNEESGLSLTTPIQTAESGEETTVAYTNMPGTANVQLLKVDEDGEPLAGAVFDLYDAEDELLAEGLETGEDGYTDTVEDLAAGDYYFVETDTPDGYAVTSENPIEFTITEDDLGTTVTVTVTDSPLQTLPNAGGAGSWVILLMSIGTACAAVLILHGRRTGIAPV